MGYLNNCWQNDKTVDIHGPQRMNPTDFNNILTFLFVPTKMFTDQNITEIDGDTDFDLIIRIAIIDFRYCWCGPQTETDCKMINTK